MQILLQSLIEIFIKIFKRGYTQLLSDYNNGDFYSHMVETLI